MEVSTRLPVIYCFREFLVSGGFMSYGGDLPELYRRAAAYADKILKGAKPGELPLQSTGRFELVINLKSAKARGLTVPQAIFLSAAEVIE
jgi:putative tryptophan/tyrosine transport system substrate-binding protein